MGLLTADGDTWLRQRRIAQPAFHRQKIAALSGVMVRAALDLADAWRAPAESGRSIDVAAEMMRLTLRIAGETLLSTDVSGDADTVGRAVTTVLEDSPNRIYRSLSVPLFIPTRKNREVLAAMKALDAVVFRMIGERRRGGGPEDLLSMLLQARDETTGEGMSDKQLRDEVMTIFLAGHETTANALAWTWYLLSKYPAAYRELRRELDTVLGGRPPGLDDIPRLKYTTMVIEESMRLYPPVWIFTRAAREPDVIGGYPIPAGSYVFTSPYVSHRNPVFWENPEGFDPERFAEGRASSLPRFVYFPFGGGPRQCIGNTFAMMETMLVLAALAQRYRLDLVQGARVEPEPVVTLRPRSGIPMTVHAA
jgi:cytochrome P450